MFSFSTGDFSIAVWVKCDGAVTDIIGDIFSKYDPVLRKGINLHVTGNSSSYSSVSDVRNVHFGIDNAVDSDWIDCGKPCSSNTCITNLVVYRGQLYAGIADAVEPHDACRVFRYEGGKEWTDCGRATNDLKNLTIHSMIVHKDELYAGTGVWDWLRLESGYSKEIKSAHLCRYEGGTKWSDCGIPCIGDRVFSLASFQGTLFASDDGKLHGNNPGANWYRYDDENNWMVEKVPMPDRISWFLSMMVYRGNLYSSARKRVYRYDDGIWFLVGDLSKKFNVRQIHTMGVYQGHLYAGTWPEGRFFRYDSDLNWSDCGYAGIDIVNQQINEINDMIVYNGRFYAGVIPKGEVWRYDGDKKWIPVKQLVQNPNWAVKDIESWSRVLCMTIFQGRFYAGTSTVNGRADETLKSYAGRIFSWEVGKCVSFDHDLGTGWKHVCAVREKGRLKLYIDGSLAAASSFFNKGDYDITNNRPLFIGFGAEDYFKGSMNKLRIYNRALSPKEIKALYHLNHDLLDCRDCHD